MFFICIQLNCEFCRSKDPKYAHLTDEEVKKVEQSLVSSFEWLEQARSKPVKLDLPPPITVAQIRQEKANFENIINPILNKPPPKAKTPPKDDKENNENKNGKQQEQQQQEQNSQGDSNQSQENMDWS